MSNWRKELLWQIPANDARENPGDINKIVGLKASQSIIDNLANSIAQEVNNEMGPHLDSQFPNQMLDHEVVLKYIKENLKMYINSLDIFDVFAE